MEYTYERTIKNIDKEWLPFFKENKDLLDNIFNKIQEYQENNKSKIFPKPKYIFHSMFYFSPKETKLVLLGQDPYFNYEKIDNKIIPQAEGLSFSVPKEFTYKQVPPSLKNIYKEIKDNYKKIGEEFEIPKHGNLLKWVKEENILLLNSSLTVEYKNPGSHLNLWEKFTDKLISWLAKNNNKNNNLTFLLLGNFAKKKKKIDIKRM